MILKNNALNFKNDVMISVYYIRQFLRQLSCSFPLLINVVILNNLSRHRQNIPKQQGDLTKTVGSFFY